jgi:hypothetical protein
MSKEYPLRRCAEPKCPAAIKDFGHAKIRAQALGWFFRKDGNKQWCPKHVPEWVFYWRARKAAKEK